jgi:hypothetical protein
MCVQVFPTEGYARLHEDIKTTTASGGPVYHRAKYTVLANPFQAISGGWQVGSALLPGRVTLHMITAEAQMIGNCLYPLIGT